MSTPSFPVSDIEAFAEHMGLEGIDIDLFYESYYKMTAEYDDYESHWDASMESIEFES